MRKYILTFFNIFIICCCVGQTKNNKYNRSNDTLPLYRHTIRLSPFSFIDPLQPSLTLGTEWHYNKKSSIGLDMSILVPIESSTGSKKSGFIVKPSFKMFLPEANYAATNFFIEPDIFWKREITNQTGWLGLGAENNVPAYYEYKNFSFIKDVVGANFKIGTQSAVFSNTVMIEVYVGAGVRLIHGKVQNEPSASYDYNTGLFSRRQLNEYYWGVSFPMGLRIALPIK